MTGWTVVADRDKGDDPQWPDIKPGDRYTAVARDLDMRSDDDLVVRIERPVADTDRARLVLDASTAQLEAEEHPVPEQNWEPLPVAGGLSPHEYSTVDGVVTIRRIERPAPTTDMTAMSHETTGFCFCGEMHGRVKDWNEYDWTALRTHQPSPHPPTREQIAKAQRALIELGDAIALPDTQADEDWFTERMGLVTDVFESVLALIQNGADR